MRIDDIRVVEHENLTAEHRLLVLECRELAAEAGAGQFVHLLVPGEPSLTLRRPFSIFKAEDGKLSILYKEVGKGTRAMASIRPGDSVSVIGPLGRGFPVAVGGAGSFPVLIAGGYGIAPLCLLANQLPKPGALLVGARGSNDIVCTAEFEKAGWSVAITTEDGSRGTRGLVTYLLEEWLSNHDMECAPELYACGPDGMLKAVGAAALERGLKAWLSLERHMGCGVGACLACVQRIRGADGIEKWGRVCREGPVFECREIVWE